MPTKRSTGIEPSSAGRTFRWSGRYAPDFSTRETLDTQLNVLMEFRPDLPESYRDAEYLFLANIDPDGHEFILRQFRKPRLLAMDTIRFWIETKREALRRELGRVNILFANDEEARLLSGEQNLIAAGQALVGYGPRLVILKKGEHGALVFGKRFMSGVLAHPCPHVIDPTGAGDAFAGGFLGYLDRAGLLVRCNVRRAAVYGSVLASFAIEDFGIDRFRTLDAAAVEGRFREFRRLLSF